VAPEDSKERNDVASSGDKRHLTSEQIQEFLDQGLSPQEEAWVQEHLAVCPLCQGEIEGWAVLFSDLGSMEELSPGPSFSQEVMAKLPVRKPLADRVRGWLGAHEGVSAPERHLAGGRIQDYLEGVLPAPEAAEALVHLTGCEACQKEASSWEGLFGALAALGRLAPAPGFAGRVMARVRIPAPLPAPWVRTGNRILAWARGFLPQTRHGWAVAGGIASAPTITMAALLYLVFSHPLLSAGNFATYVLWKASALVNSLVSAVAGAAVDSAALFEAYTLLGTLAGSPLLLGFGGLAFSALSALALWVLYRNLVATPTVERRYARTQP
jgi:anti-sigma factor RsiW